MAVISVVGTSGVGKSFLVKQLASLECMPGFFEGEEGVIPHEILQSVFSRKDPVKRCKWFFERYKRTLTRARKISDAGLDAYVDGAPVTVEAIMSDEDDKDHKQLLEEIEGIIQLKSDVVVLLTASHDALKELITNRGRTSEQHEAAVNRALRIQNEFLRLTNGEKNVIILDRSKYNFAEEKNLHEIRALIKGKLK